MQLTQKIQTNTMDTAMAKSADAWGSVNDKPERKDDGAFRKF